jgi:L-Ala-D/L-Glu epimerase
VFIAHERRGVSRSEQGCDLMELEVRTIELELAEPFIIARRSWDRATNVFVVLKHGGHWGAGEVSPDEHWGEDANSVTEALAGIDVGAFGPFDLEAPSELLGAGSARSALDIAWHDLAARTVGIPLHHLVGVGDRPAPETSMTIAITDPDQMAEKARGMVGLPIIKTKVGFDGDVEAIAAIRKEFPGRLRIDANEGWSVDEAIERLHLLASYDIELCEQPIPMGDLDGLRKVTDASEIPVYADEDAGTSADVARLASAVDGVNLKLRKAGGLRETMRAIHTARAVGLRVMIGCDLVSGVAAAAEVALAPLADEIDVDGPTLLASDPFPTVTFRSGTVRPIDGPGSGLMEPPW